VEQGVYLVRGPNLDPCRRRDEGRTHHHDHGERD
jgi:hypothetical protein